MSNYIVRIMAVRFRKYKFVIFLWLSFVFVYEVFMTHYNVSLRERPGLINLRTRYTYEDNVSITHNREQVVNNARKSHEYLFEKLKELDSSSLVECGMKERVVVLDDDLNSLEHVQGDKHEYKLYVPKWQQNIQTLTEPNTKHFLSAVLRLRLYKEDKARLTLAEFKQWMHYQFLAGTEHIYLCNHFLDENEILEEPLKRYIDLGLLTYIAWNNTVSIPGMPNYGAQNIINQKGCYQHVLKTFGKQTTWLYSFDMDEYPFVVNDQCEGFFSRYLQRVEKTKSTITSIYFDNFHVKGQGDRSRDLTIDRINRIIPQKAKNEMVKTVYKTAFTNAIDMHFVNMNYGEKLVPSSDDAKMLHYWGARTQNWGPDTKETLDSTVEFNTVRDTLAISLRSSLLSFAEYDAFSNATGP